MKRFEEKKNFNLFFKLGFFTLIFLFSFIFSNPNQAKFTKNLIANLALVEGKKELFNPAFWLKDRVVDNEVILSREEINLINQKILQRGYLLNPLNLGKSINAVQLRNYLKEDLSQLRRYIKYNLNGERRRDPEFNNYLKKIIAWPEIKNLKKIVVNYGLTINNVNLRFFPTNKVYVRKKKATHFDIMMKSHLNLDEPVAILHQSKDKKWYYVESIYARGWIEKKNLVLISYSNLKDHQSQEKELITISASSRIYPTKTSLQPLPLTIPMGVPLRLGSEFSKASSRTPSRLAILLPTKSSNYLGEKMLLKEFFIDEKDSHLGRLLLTKKNLIEQSFKFLSLPYQWGGDALGVDCSLFLVRVFNTMGINLPRASSLQKNVFNKKVVNFSENKNVFLPQIAFLNRPTHIMLFLGKYNNDNYYIHSFWSFYDEKNQEVLVKSVVISRDNLGEKSSRGSLHKKITYQGSLGI